MSYPRNFFNEVLPQAVENAGPMRVLAALAELAMDKPDIPQVPFEVYCNGGDGHIHECKVYSEFKEGQQRKFRGIIEGSDSVIIDEKEIGRIYFLTSRQLVRLNTIMNTYESEYLDGSAVKDKDNKGGAAQDEGSSQEA